MKTILLAAVLALALPGAARSAACSPLDCAPSQFTVAHGTLLGYRLAIDKPVTVVDLSTGKAKFALPSGLTAHNSLVHQDGTTLQWYDLTTGQQTASAANVDGELAALSQDGSRAVTIGARGAWVVSPTKTTFVPLPAGRWQADALRGNNLFLIRYLEAAGGYQVRLVRLSTGTLDPKPLKDPHESGTIWGMPYSRLASPDGRYLFTLYVAGNGAAMVHELNLDTAQARCIDLPGTGDYLSATTWTLQQSGRTLWAAGPGYGKVVGIDIVTRKVVRSFPLRLPYWNRGNSTRAALSPDGRSLALADGETIAVVGLAQQKVLSRTKTAAAAVGYSPAGRLWALA